MKIDKFSMSDVSVIALVIALCLFMVAVPAFAQMPTGVILGVVNDSTGALLPGATVTVTNLETGLVRSGPSGGDGTFRFPALPVGRYSVRVEHTGFKTETRTGLVLEVAQEALLNFSLQVGTSAERVEVTAEAPLVNTTSPTMGGTVNEAEMADLPLNGRNYLDLALLQPGVARAVDIVNQVGTGGTIYSSNGAPTRSNAFLLDGTPQENAFGYTASSAAGIQLGTDGIREYKVVTNNFSAAYGSGMGSQTILVSKGGSNQFHGDAFEFLRNAALDARNYFDSSYLITGRRMPQYQRNNFGGSFGGPIVKDKTFFYAVFEGLREQKGIPIVDSVLPAQCYVLTDNPCVTAVPGDPPFFSSTGTVASAMVPFLEQIPQPNISGNEYFYSFVQPSSVYYGQIRVDQTLSVADNLFVRYTTDAGNELQELGFFAPGYPQFHTDSTTRNQYLTLGENHTFSSSVLNALRLSYSRTGFAAASSSTVNDPDLLAFPFPQIGVFLIPGMTSFGNSAITPQWAAQNSYELGDDLYYTKGKHAIEAGVQIQRVDLGITCNFAGGTVLMPPSAYTLNGQIRVDGIHDFLNGFGVGYSVRIPGSNSNGNWLFSTVGMYVQDDWRVRNHLTVNMGLRYEFNTTPWESNGRESALVNLLTDSQITMGKIVQNSSLKDFSPRVGFAWDVAGNGKTSVRGGFGLYYDIAQIGSALLNEANGMPPMAYNVALPPGPISIPAPALNIDNPVGSPLGPPAQPFFHSLDYHSKQPYLYQYDLAIDRQLPGAIALSVSYVGTHGVHLFDGQEGNPCIPTSIIDGTPNWANPANATCPWGRTNTSFGSIGLDTTGSFSKYNSLQVGVTKRVSKGLEFQSSYTYSRVIDDEQGQINAEELEVRTTPKLDLGPAYFDITHNWRFNSLYHFPNIQSDNVAAKFLHGWRAGNIVSVQGGFPFSVLVSNNPSLSGNYDIHSPIDDRADLVTSANLAQAQLSDPLAVVYNKKAAITGTASQWFNPHMFTSPPLGYYGTSGRNLVRGPAFVDWDFSLSKDTKLHVLGEGGMLEFRAEFFNLVNHTQLGSFSQVLNGTPGLISTLAGGGTPRDIQLALKVIW